MIIQALTGSVNATFPLPKHTLWSASRVCNRFRCHQSELHSWCKEWPVCQIASVVAWSFREEVHCLAVVDRAVDRAAMRIPSIQFFGGLFSRNVNFWNAAICGSNNRIITSVIPENPVPDATDPTLFSIVFNVQGSCIGDLRQYCLDLMIHFHLR